MTIEATPYLKYHKPRRRHNFFRFSFRAKRAIIPQLIHVAPENSRGKFTFSGDYRDFIVILSPKLLEKRKKFNYEGDLH